MVGITRSKVIGLASPLAFLQEVEACSVGQSSQTCKLWTNKEAVCGGRILGYKLRCRFMRILHYYMIFTCMHINRTTKLFNATSIFVSCAYFAKRCLDTSGLVFFKRPNSESLKLQILRLHDWSNTSMSSYELSNPALKVLATASAWIASNSS